MFSFLVVYLAIIGSLPIKALTQTNPCTEEVMRAAEIQLFPNPQDPASYWICTEVNEYLSMPCAPGTIFNQIMKHCVPEGWVPPICPVGTCFNNADCVVDEFNKPQCLCKIGFTGERCETNINECETFGGNSICSENNGRCVDQINTFYCEWNNGAEIGMSYQTRMSTPCTLEQIGAGKQFFDLNAGKGNVFLQCTSELKFVVSKCAEMLFWHQELRTCSIERPLPKTGVCKTYPCKNDGECVDLGGSNFECVCKNGFTGALCEEAIDFCLNEPCMNGGKCVSHTGGFNCICNDLLVDQSCATGFENPCIMDNHVYMPHERDSTKYISCSLGYGFVKSCLPGLVWDQDALTCKKFEGMTKIENTPKYQAVPELTTEEAIFVEKITPQSIPEVTTMSSYDSYKTETTTVLIETVTPQSIPEMPKYTSEYSPVLETTTEMPETTTETTFFEKAPQAFPTVPTMPKYSNKPEVVVPQAFPRVPTMPKYSNEPEVVVPQAFPRVPTMPTYNELPQRQSRPFGSHTLSLRKYFNRL